MPPPKLPEIKVQKFKKKSNQEINDKNPFCTSFIDDLDFKTPMRKEPLIINRDVDYDIESDMEEVIDYRKPLKIKKKSSRNSMRPCKTIYNNLCFMGSHVQAKLNDDLLIGTEHTRKIIPECSSPIPFQEKDIIELSDEDKVSIVLHDPKFGMFSLFKYHLSHGYKNDFLKKNNTMYCSHIFSLIACLPILVFLTQWFIYISLVSDEVKNFSGNLCPQEANWERKLTMISVSLLYFVRSFFLWDNLTNRTRLQKMMPSINGWVMIDTFQEFGFNLMVYAANIWIVFNGGDVKGMILDSLAMEFIMNLDNEFEQMYFDYMPDSAVDIFDNLFISYEENQIKLKELEHSIGFKAVVWFAYLPFKILVLFLMLFPLLCFVIIFAGGYCI